MQCKYWTVLFVYWRQRFFVLHGKSIFLPHVAVDAGAVENIYNDTEGEKVQNYLLLNKIWILLVSKCAFQMCGKKRENKLFFQNSLIV